jgi:hypothetical protein
MSAVMMKTLDKAVLVGILAWFMVLWAMFPHARLAFLFWVAVISGGLIWGLLRFGKRKGKAALPPDFQPSYRTQNIAIDLDKGMLWVRPVRGKDRVLYRGNLRHWQHQWKEAHNVWGQVFRRENRISFDVADINAPHFEVRFRSYEEATIWHARLSAWINE